METDYSKIDYIYGTKSNHKFSTAPHLSDYVFNQTIGDHVVGTLIRYSPSGRYVNYLIDQWSKSDDELTWHFQFKKGLQTENGHPINAKGYIEGLKKVLKIYYGLMGPDLFFQYVDGYNEFVSEKANDIKGLKHISINKFSMSFKRKPIDLIEHLSMSYYGYYSLDNFNLKGEWKDNRFIDSSGPYRISQFQKNDKMVELTARDGWFSLKKEAPKTVRVFFKEYNEAIKQSGLKIINKKLRNKAEIPKGYTYTRGTLARITTYILSPNRFPFDDIDNRQAFKYYVNEYIDKNPINLLSAQSTKKFFPSFKDSLTTEVPKVSKHKNKKIRVYLPFHKSGPSSLGFQFDAVNYALHKMNLTPIYENLANKNSSEKHQILVQNKEFNIRSGSVITDYEIKPSMIWMMFCSKMGIAFTDPSGELCKLTRNYKDSEDSDIKKYSKTFQNILERDSSVIPLYRYGPGWISSKEIKNTSLSPVVANPRFDQMEL